MNKKLIAIVMLFTMNIFGVYWYFSHQDYQLRISAEQIKEKLSERLPLTKSYLVIFQLTLDHPRVVLEPGSNRIAIGLDATLMTQGNAAKSLSGTIDVSSGIKYIAQEGAFFLTEPRIDKIDIQGLSGKYMTKLHMFLEGVMAEYYQTHPVYKLNASETKQATARRVLKDIVVDGREVVIKLGL